MLTRVPLEEGVFYSLDDGFILCFSPQKPGHFSKGDEYPLNTMLRMWDLKRDDEAIGFFFSSPFKTEGHGGYLVTFMENKREKATSSKLVIRHDKVMVYDIEGCGSMALSTKVSPEVLSILMEQ